ncbi:MAG: hypothetical protein PHQ00_05585 [Phycisphaerae bacterium]|nr:hypothetical protein [Phycisphaerae bacterium]
MITIIIALIVALIFALWGYGKKLFPVWAFAFNVIIAVYLGVMLSPTIAESAGGTLEFLGAYTDVAVMFAIAIIYFVTAQFLSNKYLTNTYCVSFPKAVNDIGAAILAFAGGFLIANFILFAVSASPLKEIPIISKCIPADMKKISSKPVIRACKFVSGCSLQYGDQKICKAIETISWRCEVRTPPKAAAPKDANLPTPNQPAPVLSQPRNTIPDLNE